MASRFLFATASDDEDDDAAPRGAAGGAAGVGGAGAESDSEPDWVRAACGGRRRRPFARNPDADTPRACVRLRCARS
jgi:hypothetical protein